MKRYCIFLFVWCCLSVQAKNYYYSPAEAEALKKALSGGELKAGDRVILKAGTYNDLGHVHFQGKGTARDSIILKAEHPGQAVISGALEFTLSGEYLQVEGFYFHKAWALKSSMIDFRKEKGEEAFHSRFTNCVIDDCNDPGKSEKAVQGVQPYQVSEYWMGLRGANNRVDHCYFANKRIGGLVIQVWLEEGSHINNHQIDHNLFGFRQPYGGNGAEIIRIGHSWSSQLESRTLVENNIFLHCDGENEIISVKSCHNILRKNLFYESRGGLVCRHGHYNVIESNTFVGNRIRGTLGIRVINQGHTVYDNYLAGLNGFGLLVRMGVYERPTPETDIKQEPLTSYHRVENVDIAYNTFIDCEVLEFGSGRGDKAPRSLRFAFNRIYNKENNLRIFRPDEVLPGITFLDNTYCFEDGARVESAGFVRQPMPEHLPALGKERVRSTIQEGIGACWYEPNKRDLSYIKKYDE